MKYKKQDFTEIGGNILLNPDQNCANEQTIHSFNMQIIIRE